MPGFVLAQPNRLSVEAFARRAELHPDLVRRLVALSLLDATRDADGRIWLAPTQLAVAARIQRLRAALPLNYAALGLVIDLLDRIDQLENALRTTAPDHPTSTAPRSTSRWT